MRVQFFGVRISEGALRSYDSSRDIVGLNHHDIGNFTISIEDIFCSNILFPFVY